MDVIRVIVLLIMFALISNCDARKETAHRRSKRNHVNCRPKSLVRYILRVHTLWSKRTFPKMFPTYRPHAQWSSVVGRTHGPKYQMWKIGENATSGVKLFAEQGDYSHLDAESVQGYNDILDCFAAPPVPKSVGQTSTVIVLDGHHSKLSFMMKIIPSPDWFIGVSGLELCFHGRWKKKVRADLYPLDAGTDQGLTFTSPNWPNIPAVPISGITSSFPDHPASSFMYPEYKKLPRLAYVELDIVSEYKQGKSFMEVPNQHSSVADENDVVDNDTKAIDGEMTVTASAKAKSTISKPEFINTTRKTDSTAMDKLDTSSRNKDISIKIDDLDPLSSTKIDLEAHVASVKESSAIDCQVEKWSEWSACSHTCGLGHQERSRNVSSYPKNGGANCPRLRQTNVCGSMRNCQIARFTFLQSNVTERQLREGLPSRRRVRSKKTTTTH